LKRIEALENITSSDEEYQDLRLADHVYVVQGRGLDDNDLYEFVYDLEYADWFHKLRKTPDGSVKIQNDMNNQEWMWGYVITVSSEKLFDFERDAFMKAIKHGYKLDKIDTGPTIKEENQKIFEGLFEEI
jgi:hypothetical protein